MRRAYDHAFGCEQFHSNTLLVKSLKSVTMVAATATFDRFDVERLLQTTPNI